MPSKRETEPLTLGPKEKPRVYHLLWPTVGERTQYRHAVTRAGGKRHSQLALLRALRRGGERLMADLPVEIREASLRRVDAMKDALLALAAAAREDGMDLSRLLAGLRTADEDLADLESAVREGDIRYAAMCADVETFPAISGLTALHLFLAGWDGFEVPLERASAIRLSEASLGEIPEEDLPAIAAQIERMFGVPESKRKKSASLSSPPSGSETSIP